MYLHYHLNFVFKLIAYCMIINKIQRLVFQVFKLKIYWKPRRNLWSALTIQNNKYKHDSSITISLRIYVLNSYTCNIYRETCSCGSRISEQGETSASQRLRSNVLFSIQNQLWSRMISSQVQCSVEASKNNISQYGRIQNL